jgi:hypothetical protein
MSAGKSGKQNISAKNAKDAKKTKNIYGLRAAGAQTGTGFYPRLSAFICGLMFFLHLIFSRPWRSSRIWVHSNRVGTKTVPTLLG